PRRVAAPNDSSSGANAKSIAVLPFENLSDDKNAAYFADGIQDEILTKLASIADLKVISRTSTAKYKSKPEELKTVSQQLGVSPRLRLGLTLTTKPPPGTSRLSRAIRISPSPWLVLLGTEWTGTGSLNK